MIVYGVYKIWFCRNTIAHGKESLPAEMAAALTTKERVYTFLKPRFSFCVINEDVPLKWIAPEGHTIKINCDGSWFKETRQVSAL